MHLDTLLRRDSRPVKARAKPRTNPPAESPLPTAVAPTREQVEQFAVALDAIRDRALAQVGERDARYVRRIIALARGTEVAGRAALFAGLFPPAWVAGVALLAVSKALENMEIGHNVMHGQYDFMNDPALAGRSYEWDWACPGDHWRHSHNYVHHTFTNVVGLDRDVGYGLLRMTEQQPWHAGYLLQPFYALGLMLAFEAGVAVHDLELNRVLRGQKSLAQFAADAAPLLRKAAPQLLKDYVLFPLLAGPAGPAVFAGNLSANVIRNAWAFLVIFCGHFPEGVQMFRPEEIAGETRGQWYMRQIAGSANVTGPTWFHVLSGHLSHQIEHHLFPDLPAPRYREIAREVEAACAAHCVGYNSGPFLRQARTSLGRILRHTFPARAQHPASVAVAAA